jgi:hypothetical protein
MTTIGKANKYYTLWHIEKVEQWNGPYKYYNVNYTFHKNLAMDKQRAIDKVEEVYGNNYKIDETVRGSGSWIKNGYKQKVYVCNGENTVIGFGKYNTKTLKEVFDTDPKYFDWLVKNADNNIVDTIKKCQFWIDKLAKDKVDIDTKSLTIKEVGYDETVEVTFERNLSVGEGVAYYYHNIGDLRLELQFKHFNVYYYSGHEYGLPVIKVGNKKSGKRIKNKTYKLKLKPITFGKMETAQQWNDDTRKYEMVTYKSQEVEVIGMKVVN